MHSIPSEAPRIAVAHRRPFSALDSAKPMAVPAAYQHLFGWMVGSVAAGFPSPAEDHAGQRIDLFERLNSHPQATFFMKVSGLSMIDAGISDGDVIVVDRSIKPKNGQIVVAVIDGEFTVKQLSLRAGVVKLKAANPTFKDIRLNTRPIGAICRLYGSKSQMQREQSPTFGDWLSALGHLLSSVNVRLLALTLMCAMIAVSSSHPSHDRLLPRRQA
jgi:DNA polymerase V